MTRRMMLDVESVGLHGEALAYGYVIEEQAPGARDSYRVVEEGFAIANPLVCSGERQDFDWLKTNVFPWINAMNPVFPPEGGTPIIQSDPTTGVLVTLCDGPVSLRETFWSLWERERARETQLWGDVCWPVEANFLSACVRAKTGRKFKGPYPLLDVAPLWQAHCGGVLLRQPSELPEHHPLMDCRHSLRKLSLAEARSQA